jgi:rhamnogalacturonan endolyase
MKTKFLAALLIALLMSAAAFGENEPVALFQEDFSGYRAGLFSSVVGAHTEYHYLPEAAEKGRWTVSTFRSSVPSQRAWRIVEVDGARAMAQTYKNKYTFFHPMIIAGDSSWENYTVELNFASQTDTQSGLVFRYKNDRCYYFAGVVGQEFVLKMVQHATDFHKPLEKILDKKPLPWTPGDDMRLSVSVRGNHLRAQLNDVVLEADDTTYPQGKIGLTADGPSSFKSVLVSASVEEEHRIQKAILGRANAEKSLQAANPKPVLWKKFATKDFGMARNVRFGDLDGDGQMEALFGQVRHHGPKDRNSELSCLTAVNMDGEVLWQIGEPDPWKNHLTNDVGFQIHDLDGDGANEVVYCMDMEIVVADGATGKTKYKKATPETPPNTKAPYDKFPRILGDSLYFCDLRGTGRDADIIIKDRYLSLWALNDKLETLWHAQCVTGHYPYAYDVDGDGKDELMQGYTLFDDDGAKLWSLEGQIKDHADGVAIVPFIDGAEPRLLCAASDEGMVFADMKGNIVKHHYVGHVQNPAIADFRPDLPGLEAISINFWGNQGIVHFYNADGEIYHDFEPAQHGSMCLPVNWTGKAGDYWLLSPNVEDGGLFDGWGRRVVRFPADGHPDMCNNALDLTGDCRDEIVVWDPSEMWVYTQDDNPKKGRLYAPKRNATYNESNYKASFSLPAWKEKDAAYTAIDMRLFHDGDSHWQRKFGRDRNDERFTPEQITEIADNMLRYQNPDGGWPKNIDYAVNIDEAEFRAIRGASLKKSTLDNRCTYPQIQYLAKVYQQTNNTAYREAAERGLAYILHDQRPTGGWRGSDVDAITFNDDVMTGTMRLLLEIREGTPHYTWIEEELRQQIAKSLKKAIDATLACQIEVNGVKTAWCQQHDHETFAPVQARSYELPAICPAESTGIVQFLRQLPGNAPRVAQAINAALTWFQATQINGIRLETITIDPVRFENHTATSDVVVVEDPNAPPLWTRFYEIETNRPFFCNRDGTTVYTLAEVALERRTGYGWYGGWPKALLKKSEQASL